VVFQTYDPQDLTYITLSRIGSTVVDASAITFLSKSVASSSGDARKHLEIVSRTISHLMEDMTEEALNAEHQGPIVKLPHIKKMLNQSITKTKDLLQASPSLDQHVLCLCMPLAGRVGSSPLPLKQLLWLLSECYGVVEIEGTSHLRSILERLVDTGLLKLKDKKIAMDEIRFDEQLDEVESAVRDVLMSQQFYKDMATKLQSISLTLLL
jgi:Cdc6-like AAA superfamily ATPase